MTASPRLITGRAYRLGDYIDCDAILPVRFCTRPTPEILRRFCLTIVDPDFPLKAGHDQIIVAGKDFGRGSANENAVRALMESYVRAVVATSFAALFQRNALNLGFPALTADDCLVETETGDRIVIDLESWQFANLASGCESSLGGNPGLERDILLTGGLIPWTRRHSTTPSEPAARRARRLPSSLRNREP